VARASAAEDYLLAQRASHSQALLTVFTDAAQLYFRVVAIRATVDAKREAESAAQNVYRVSTGRHHGGIAPISDVLQAETAYRQSTLDRMQAEGNLEVAKGQLATLIGMSANIAVPLRPPKLFTPAADDIGAIDVLIQKAERQHPSIVAAAAQLSAKTAESRVAAMSQLPTISLTTDLSGSIRAGDPSLPPKTRYVENTVGIQIKIPLSFVASSYARREALANVAAARSDLDGAELTVALDVWTTYQKLKTDVDRYYVTSKLVSAGEHSYAVASGRYQHGIGGILEVLNAQSVVANARQEQIEVQSSYCSDRLVLSANLGKLDLPSECTELINRHGN
jgi:outer membrane protein